MTFLRLIILGIVCFFCVLSTDNVLGEDSYSASLDKVTDEDRIKNPSIEATSNALAHYVMGSIYDNFGDTTSAIAEYRDALDEKNDVVEIYIKLGVDYLLLSKLGEAVEVLEKASEIDPENTRVHLLLAIVHTEKGEYNKAATEHQETLKYDPDNLKALTFLTDILIAQHKLDKAAEVYERILRIRSDDAFLYFNLGVIYSKLDLLDKSEEKLKKAIEVDEQYLEAQILLGFIYEIDEKYSKAKEQYEKVLLIDSRNREARIRLGQVYFKTGDINRAIKENDKLIQLEETSTEPYLRKFTIYVSEKKYVQAEETLNTALENCGPDGVVYASLGYLYGVMDEQQKSIEFYSLALKENPSETEYKYYLATALDRSGRTEDAIEILEEVARDSKTHIPEAYNYLGYLYAEKGIKLDRSIELISRALEQDKQNGAYLDSLGWAYYQKGMISEALIAIEQAVVSLPNDEVVMEHLGDIYFAQGKTKQAIKMWEKTLKLTPKNESLKEKLKEIKSK